VKEDHQVEVAHRVNLESRDLQAQLAPLDQLALQVKLVSKVIKEEQGRRERMVAKDQQVQLVLKESEVLKDYQEQ